MRTVLVIVSTKQGHHRKLCEQAQGDPKALGQWLSTTYWSVDNLETGWEYSHTAKNPC